MSKEKTKAILATCGEGGHAEELRRVMNSIAGKHDIPYVLITEDSAQLREPSSHIIQSISCPSVREKHGTRGQVEVAMRGAWTAIRVLLTTLRILRNYDIRLVVSTGPGIAVPVAIAARIRSRQVIHIETWCRLSTRSLTGRCMYALANEFWFQHKSLATLYPKGKFVGNP